MRKISTFLCSCLVLSSPLAASPPAQPALPPAQPVAETLFGTTLSDPYRYFEAEGPVVVDWMKAEGRYTRAVLDSLPGHDQIRARLAAMSGSFDVVQSITPIGDRTFYEQRTAGSDNFDLMVREADGSVRKLVDVSAIRAANGGEPFAINYFSPSDSGAKVAVGISRGGSEDASLYVYDVATGKQVAGPVPNARFGGLSWLPDDKALFTNLLTPLRAGEPETDKYKNSKVYVWNFKSAPFPIVGPGLSRVNVDPAELPFVQATPGSSMALAATANGVQNEIALWTAPVASAASADAPWVKLVGREDDITKIAVVSNRIFLLSHKDAPTFKVLEVRAGQPLSAAKVVVPAQPGRLLEGITAAADGLYVNARRGVYSELFKVGLDGGPEQPIALPFKGSIGEVAADPRAAGVKLIVDSWAVPPTTVAYDPRSGKFANLNIGTQPRGFDPSLYEAFDLAAKAPDGVEVPLSLVTAKAARHPRPVLLWAYGSYGISQFPGFGTRTMATLPNGIDLATCHVRGGGELGETWRLGGKDANKPNTWRDLIACGRALIADGYTTPKMLFIGGGSAGGITMGRAMEEAPTLFAGVFDLVPAANPTRMEFSPNGPPNIPEFGTVKTREGFKNLLAMDSVVHVQRGVKYPPVLISTGLNDPRVSSWEPAKLAATLRAAGDPNPVLLRVDEKAGHGIGSTKSQTDDLYADVAAFILWRSAEYR